MRNLLFLAIIFATLAASGQTVRNDTRSDRNIRQYGGIIQGDTARKRIALVFTAAAWADGADTIINTMKSRGVKGSFFFTGGFYEKFPGIIARLVKDGHYVGSHGYAHLLYAPWGSKRDSTIVSKEEFDAAAQKEIADKKVDTPEKLEKFNKFMAYTWENGDVNHDNYLSPEEFAAQRQRNREKFSRKK